MYSGQHQVAQILGNASQHRSGGLCLMTRGLRQSEEPFERGIHTEKRSTCLYRLQKCSCLTTLL